MYTAPAPAPAPSQAPAPAPRKRHRVRNTMLGFIGAIVLIIIVQAVANGGGSGKSSGSAAPASGKSTATAAPAAKAAGIGTAVRDGKFQFVVTSVSQQKTVGDTADGLGNTAQGEYTILHVTVTNISNAPQTLEDGAQYLFDSSGRKYNVDSAADLEIGAANGSSSTWFENINPGNTVQGQLAFDMPAGTQAVKAELHDSMFSGGVAVKVG